MCTWRAPCWSPTWWQLDTPAPRSTHLRRLPWRQWQPWGAPSLLLCLVSVSTTTKGKQLQCEKRLKLGTGFLRFRHLLPVWRPKWGGGLRQPECHQPGGSPPPVEADLLLRPCTPGLCSCSLAGQSSQQGSCTGSLLPKGQGEKQSKGQESATAPSLSNNIHSCNSTVGGVLSGSSCFTELGTVLLMIKKPVCVVGVV